MASPAFVRHQANEFDVMLMEGTDRGASVRGYLTQAFTENRPWDRIFRDLILPEGQKPAQKAANEFLRPRLRDLDRLTTDVSVLFFGVNVSCGQCHDHPLVNAYKQAHYYGVFAFLSRSFVFTDKAKKLAVFAEKGEGEVSYQSVFDPKLTKNTGPRLPGGPPLKEPTFAKGKEYRVPPGKGVASVPAFSRRARLGELLTAADNVQFRRTAANRLWALMLGRGLVHPVDFDHAENPPSHPELLQTLADELAALKFDVKRLVEQRCFSVVSHRRRCRCAPRGSEPT